MRYPDVRKVEGITKGLTSFPSGQCYPGSDEFEVFGNNALADLGECSPRHFAYLKVTLPDGKHAYWAADGNRQFLECKDLKEAKATCKYDELVEEWNRKVAEDDEARKQGEINSLMDPIDRLLSTASRMNPEQKKALGEILGYGKRKRGDEG